MPETGDFDRNNASASPASWGDAFAALPQDTPETGGWQRLQARMPAATATASRVRRRWSPWLAAAAALGLALALPLWMSRDAAIQEPAATSAQRAVTPAPMMVDNGQLAATALPAQREPGRDTSATDDGGDAIATAKPGRASASSNPPRIAPAHRPVRTVAEPAGATRLAESDAPTQSIESLYAESAQLEQLLAMVRDERVASGASAALSSELDDRVAGIDDALTQPGLDAADRDRLWRQRVDAMQQLVGIETTRVLAGRGDTFNASLVSID